MANESVTVTQTLDQVTVVSEGPVGLNAGGTIGGPLTVGVDGTGHDVKFFGDTAGKYMQWDQSADKLFINGELEVNGSATTFNSTVVTIDDPVFTLGGQEGSPLTGNDSKDRGIEFFYNDGAAKRGFMGYDDSADAFTFLTNASNSNDIFSGTAASLVTGAISAGGHINLNDNQLQNVGVLQGTASGGLLLKYGDGNFAIVGNTSGKLDLRHAGSVKLETSSTGIEVTGTLAMGGNQISGVTVLGGSGSNLQINAANGEHFIYGSQDAQVLLYYNGVAKLQTANVGVLVSGRATLEQSQDDNGLEVKGFDDKSGETLKAYVKSTGDSRIDATRALRLFSGESYGGGIGSGTTTGVTWDAFNQFTFTAESSARIPLSIEGASGQSGDLLNITSNGGSAGDLLTVDGSGKVGIGTTSVAYPLHINGATTATLAIQCNGNNAEGSKIRLIEGSANFQGGFIHYDGSANALNIGVHENNNSTLSEDVNAITIPRDTGNVGIGNTSPAALLHLSHATNPTFRISRTGTGQVWEQSIDSSGRLLIKEAASEGGTQYTRVAIDDDGNFGIGTAAPSSILHVEGATPTVNINGTSSAGPTVQLSGTFCSWSIENQYSGGANNDMFRIRNSALSSDALVINRGNNNVGIGTTAPAYKLDVDGDIRVLDGHYIYAGDSTDLQIRHDGSNSKITNATGDLYLINSADDKDIIFQSDDGSGGVTTYLTVDGGNERVTVSKNLHTGNLYPTGQLSLDGDIFVQDSHTINVGNGSDMTLKHDGSNSRLNNATGDLYVSNTATDKDIIFQAKNTSGGSEEYMRLDGSAQTVLFSKTVQIAGNLQVDGTTQTINSTVVTIDDPILTLGGDTAPSSDDNKDRGIEFRYYDGSAKVGFMGWDDSAGGFTLLKDATNSSEVFSGTATNLTLGETILTDASSGSTHRIQATGNNFFFHLGHGVFQYSCGVRGNRGSAVGMESDGVDSYLALCAGGSEKVRIATDGKVGIGTTSPAAFLHLSHATAPTLRLSRTGTGQIWEHSIDSSGRLLIREAASEGGTQYTRVAIDDDGNFGIGTGGPTSLLHVEGATPTVNINGTSSTGPVVQLSGTFCSWTIENQYSGGANNDMFRIRNSALSADALVINRGNNNIGIGTTAPSFDLDINGDVRITDNKILRFGDGGDFQLHHNGTDSKIHNFTGDLTIANFADDKDIIFQSDDGSGGVHTYFFLDGNTGYTNFPDSKHLTFGTGHDFLIHHDSNHTYVEQNGTGHLHIRQNTNDKDILLQSDDGSGGIATYITIDGSREEVVANKPLIQTPGTNDPANNGELAFTVVSNTALKIKYKGTDGLVRSTSLTLS